MRLFLNRFKSRPVTTTLLALLAVLIVSGCKNTRVDEISRILADPSAYSQKDVVVAGRVTRVIDPSAGLLNLAVYQVEDKSGKIWVVSRSGAPSVGAQVGVKARIRQDSTNLGSVSGELFGAVLNEIERRTR